MHIAEKHTDIRSLSPKQETNWLGCAAGRAIGELLSSIYGPITRAWLTKQLDGVAQSSALHVGCGDGGDTFLLASPVANGTNLTGTDKDPVQIEKALFEIGCSGQKHINFTYSELAGFDKAGEFDLVFSQFLNPGFPAKASEWANLARVLKPGGVLFLQVVDLSGLNSFPYNHALARSVELIGKFGNKPFQASNLQDFALELLKDAGFERFETTFSPAAFLPTESNHILSLFLEWRRAEILTSALTSKEEFNSLLMELKYYESQPDTLISRPRMYQIRAKRKAD